MIRGDDPVCDEACRAFGSLLTSSQVAAQIGVDVSAIRGAAPCAKARFAAARAGAVARVRDAATRAQGGD